MAYFKPVMSGGKRVFLNIKSISHIAPEDNKSRVFLGIAVGGAEAAHSTILVDEPPEALIGDMLWPSDKP